VSFAEAGAAALVKWGFATQICEAVNWQIAPSVVEDDEQRELTRHLSRSVAIADWHYGAKNEKSLLRADVTITDIEEINQRAAAKVVKVGFGF